MVFVFLIAAIYIDTSEGGISLLEAWLDWMMILVLATATSTFQILYNLPLQAWYYEAIGRDPTATRDVSMNFDHVEQVIPSFVPEESDH